MTAVMLAQNFKFDEMTYTPEATTFKLFAPKTAKRVVVRLYKEGLSGRLLKTAKMQLSPEGLWTVTIKGDLKGLFYTFDMGRGECPGVFAKAVGINGRRAAILDLTTTDPVGWAKDVRPVIKMSVDHVIYEMHHRDFSVGRDDAQYKGKFLALTEPWAIQHLTALGVNAVHVLPSYDYGSVDDTRLDMPQYNWGYDPVNYNVPEGSYSTNPYDPACRIREFKQMVQALHKAGIRVILDVVYNHTYDVDHSNFQNTYPDYYYRKNADGTYSNGSGCGNETASEQPMMRRFMLESVKHWINEYHIDGFRFDLMGCHDIETMNEIRHMVNEIDPTILIYGEGWSAGSCALSGEQLGVKANVTKMPGIAAFSDEIRDALRGPFDNDSKPGIFGQQTTDEQQKLVESLKFGIVGGISHPQVNMLKVNYSKEPWALDPSQLISYVSCHDDMCLTDRLRASIPNITEAELIRLDLLAQTAVFTSQGIPFMLAGEEVLRSKKGVHNSFESPDSINVIDWSNAQSYPQVLKYYQRLTQLRKHHPAFRLGSADLVRKHLEFLEAPAGVVAFRLKNYAGRDDWRDIIVVLNTTRERQSVRIPDDKWVMVCSNGVIEEEGVESFVGEETSVSPQSAQIIHN